MSYEQGAAMVQQQLKSFQFIVVSMAMALAIIGVVGLVVLPPAELQPLHLVIALAVGLSGTVIAGVMTASLVRPVERDAADPLAAAMERFRTASFTQMAVAEAGGLVLFALAFVLQIHPALVLLGMIASAIGVLLVAWPSQARLRRVRAQLEREGARCPIDEAAAHR